MRLKVSNSFISSFDRFKIKYHPEDSNKRKEEQIGYLKVRKVIPVRFLCMITNPITVESSDWIVEPAKSRPVMLISVFDFVKDEFES